jgi:hypothetical protein
METQKLLFVRETRSYPTFNFDKPTIVYSHTNIDGENITVEFLFTVNCKITINNNIYFCNPLKNNPFPTNIIISSNNFDNTIGTIEYWGCTHKKKRVILFSDNEPHQKWIYEEDNNIFSKKFWTRNPNQRTITNGTNKLTIEFLKKTNDQTNFNTQSIAVTQEGIFENLYLLTALTFYMFELED